jgi:ATP-dependent RNA helicase RhlE
VPEDYVHRIGRTGRAGASGEAISLVSPDENEYVNGIEKLLGEKLPSEILAGFEPSLLSENIALPPAQNNSRKAKPQTNRNNRRRGKRW